MSAIRPVMTWHHEKLKIFTNKYLHLSIRVFIRNDAVRGPLQPVHDGSFAVLKRNPKFFQVKPLEDHRQLALGD